MAVRTTIRCADFRDWLEREVLARLAEAPVSHAGAPGLAPSTTSIVVDVAPYASVREADAAEMAIDWHAPDQKGHRRACRVAFAALELQRYLRRITGSSGGFAIVSARQKDRSCLVLGLDENETSVDGAFEIAEDRGAFVFRGRSIQSCLYAVYEYLEQIGCRFYRPGATGEILPDLSVVPAPEATQQTPSFPVRQSAWTVRKRAECCRFWNAWRKHWTWKWRG